MINFHTIAYQMTDLAHGVVLPSLFDPKICNLMWSPVKVFPLNQAFSALLNFKSVKTKTEEKMDGITRHTSYECDGTSESFEKTGGVDELNCSVSSNLLRLISSGIIDCPVPDTNLICSAGILIAEFFFQLEKNCRKIFSKSLNLHLLSK